MTPPPPPPRSPGSNDTAPNRLANWKHCAVSTQTNPHLLLCSASDWLGDLVPHGSSLGFSRVFFTDWCFKAFAQEIVFYVLLSYPGQPSSFYLCIDPNKWFFCSALSSLWLFEFCTAKLSDLVPSLKCFRLVQKLLSHGSNLFWLWLRLQPKLVFVLDFQLFNAYMQLGDGGILWRRK